MAVIPHLPLHLADIRPLDIWLLLGIGLVWEVTCRSILLFLRKKPRYLRQKEEAHRLLLKETNAKRQMGPSAFVETSKLERQVLAQEKELAAVKERRKATYERMERLLLRHGNIALTFVIFIVYYSVPLFTFAAMEPPLFDDGSIKATTTTTLSTILFPISYLGLGMRISRFGLADSANSVGALAVMWSSQVLCSKLYDSIDALVLQ